LILDANRDSVLDVILDGHDKQKSILIGVISNKGDYRVLSIKESELVDPKSIKNVFEGKSDQLNKRRLLYSTPCFVKLPRANIPPTNELAIADGDHYRRVYVHGKACFYAPEILVTFATSPQIPSDPDQANGPFP
jgi:hypothetical protein